jgi:hypothetical protein
MRRTRPRRAPERCGLCDRQIARRTATHRHHCSARLTAGLVPARRCI